MPEALMKKLCNRNGSTRFRKKTKDKNIDI